MIRREALLALSLALLPTAWPGRAAADPVTAGDASCDVPATDRPPDPRCGETLDGRTAVEPPMTATKAALVVPRLATRAFFWPIVETSDVFERYQLVDWMDAVLTTDDGLVGVRPIVHYSTSFLPSGGARLFYDR